MTHSGGGATRLWQRIDIYVLVIVFPLLLAGVGLWERNRATEAHELYANAAQNMAASRDNIRVLAAREPNAMIEAGGRVLTASMAMAELDKLIPMAQRGTWLSQIRKPVAIATVLGGGLALLAGLTGLLLSAQAGHAARRSRDQLIASFSRIHKLLPLILGTLMVGIALGLVGIAVFETISMWFWDRVSGNMLKLAVFGLLLAGLAIFGAIRAILGLRDIFSLSRIEPFAARGRRITEEDGPGLWRFVREIARKQEATAPDAIVIALDGGFYVTEHPVRLHPEETVLEGRTLHIPAPYLEFFDEDELAAVIGHELAHFVGEDTTYSRHFNPIYTGLERALLALHEASTKGFALNPAFRLGAHMMDSFDHAVKHWSRLREFEADRLSSLVNGPRSVASSLLRSSVVAPVIDHTLDRRFQDPEEGDADLVAQMVAAVDTRGWPPTREHLDDRATHPTDTHPSTPHRVEKLAIALDEDLIAHATRRPAAGGTAPGSLLFADWLAVRRQLSRDFDAHVRELKATHRAYLESAVAAVGDETVTLYENVGPMIWVMGIVAALFGTGAIVTLAMVSRQTLEREPVAFAIMFGICLLVAVCFGLYGLRLRRQSHEPVMALTRDALVTPRLAQPLRWQDIAAYQVHAGSRFELTCLLTPEAALPERAARRRRTRIDPKKRQVVMQCFGIRKMKPQAFSDLIGRYLEASSARAALANQTVGTDQASDTALVS
jgi:Zn-dependent protease with chaperone function